MTPQLYTGLKHNQVNLSENYQLWNKVTMIQKIGMVIGLEWTYDPDPSYVLTVDNVIKIMAIHMRFRYGKILIRNNMYYTNVKTYFILLNYSVITQSRC